MSGEETPDSDYCTYQFVKGFGSGVLFHVSGPEEAFVHTRGVRVE